MAQVAEAGFTLLVQEMVAQFMPSEDDAEEGAPAERDYSKLEQIGFQVGVRIVERLTLEKPRFSDNLEAVKFICKDFWTAVFKKQVDNLKTNHKVRRHPSARCVHRCLPEPSLLVRVRPAAAKGAKLRAERSLVGLATGDLRPDGQQLPVDQPHLAATW